MRALQLPDTGCVVLFADWPQEPPGWLIRFRGLAAGVQRVYA